MPPVRAAQQATPAPIRRIVVPWTTAQQLFVSGNKPDYPIVASMAHVQGTVRIQFVIAKDGSAKELFCLSGAIMLKPAAMYALQSWRFRPPTSGGVPVEIETIAPLDFYQDKAGPTGIVDALRKDSETHPKDAKKRIALGDALLNAGQVDAAEEEFRQALALRPNDPTAHSGLGTALSANGDVDGAISEYRQALALKPKDPEAHFNLSAMLEQKGDLDGAISEERSAIQWSVGDRDCGRLGMLLLKKGDTVGAIEALKKALRSPCDAPEVHYELGRAEEQSGQPDEAMREYRKAAALNPTATEYQSAVQTLSAKPKP